MNMSENGVHLTDCRMDAQARVVSFANGLVARELIVDVDDLACRVAWASVGGRSTHHNASAQVFDDGPGRCRVVWVADLLPHEMAPAIAAMIGQGTAATKRTLEGVARAPSQAAETDGQRGERDA